MLSAWYPLNGDLRNRGLGDSDLTQISSPVFVAGKFGTCLSRGEFKWRANQTNTILNNNKLSIAFWLYVDMDTGTMISADEVLYNDFTFGNDNETVTNESGDQLRVLTISTEGSRDSVLFGNYHDSTLGGKQFSIFNLPSSNDITLDWQNYSDGVYERVLNATVSNCIPARTWTHVCVTYNNPVVKIWINGELLKTCECVVDTTFNFDTNVITDSLNHRFNDYRIYDHCLSKKEILNLSHGLYSHYLLNAMGINVPEEYQTFTEHEGSDFNTKAVEDSSDYEVWMEDSNPALPSWDENEYDCTGYDNHAIKTSNIQITSDTKRYSKSYLFGTTDYVDCYFAGMCTDKMTVNFWAKMDDWSQFTNTSKFASCVVSDKNGGWAIDSSNGYPSFVVYIDQVGFVRATSSEDFSSISSGWHMFTAEYDGVQLKLYIDGILKGSNVTGRTNASVLYCSGAHLYIHAEPVTNDVYCNTGDETVQLFSSSNDVFMENFNDPITGSSAVKMSDFRVYNTSLSDYFINELFDFRYSIDRNNYLHVYEMNEDSTNNIVMDKKGTVTVNSIEDADLIKIYGAAKLGIDEYYED